MDQLRVPDRDGRRTAGLTAAVRLVGADDGPLLRGGSHQLKAGVGDTEGALTVWVSRTKYGKGPPLHLHEREDELFYVLGGRYELACGGESAVGEAGTLAYMPRLSPHVFRGAAEDTPCRLLHAVVPGGFERYLASITDSDAETADGRELRRVAGERYGIRFSDDPRRLAPGAEREPPPRILSAPSVPDVAGGEVHRLERLSFGDSGGRVAFDELLFAPGAAWRLAPAPTPRVAYLLAGELEVDDGVERRSMIEGVTAIVSAGASCSVRHAGIAQARLVLLSAELPAGALRI